ncbi:acyl-CoA dehydrogenase family protein [Parasphingorhabdus pacifica]
MPIAITGEQRDLQESIRAWAATFDTTTVRNREPKRETSEQPRNSALGWAELAEIGLFSIAVPGESGGAGAGIVDLATALEETASALVPGSVLPTCLASVLLGWNSDSPVAAKILPALMSGQVAVAVSGELPLVLGVGEAPYLVLSARTGSGHDEWLVVELETVGVRVETRQAADFSRSLGRVGESGRTSRERPRHGRNRGADERAGAFRRVS